MGTGNLTLGESEGRYYCYGKERDDGLVDKNSIQYIDEENNGTGDGYGNGFGCGCNWTSNGYGKGDGGGDGDGYGGSCFSVCVNERNNIRHSFIDERKTTCDLFEFDFREWLRSTVSVVNTENTDVNCMVCLSRK